MLREFGLGIYDRGLVTVVIARIFHDHFAEVRGECHSSGAAALVVLLTGPHTKQVANGSNNSLERKESSTRAIKLTELLGMWRWRD